MLVKFRQWNEDYGGNHGEPLWINPGEVAAVRQHEARGSWGSILYTEITITSGEKFRVIEHAAAVIDRLDQVGDRKKGGDL